MKAGTITDMILVMLFSVMFCVDIISRCYITTQNVALVCILEKTMHLCFSGIYDDDPEITTLDRGDFGK